MIGSRLGTALLAALASAAPAPTVRAQVPDAPPYVEVERPDPPPREDFETDANRDGAPDGWYNLRDARFAPGGYGGGPSKCLRFENRRAGREARASRAFGADGRKYEALIVGLWVRMPDQVRTGERVGQDPSLLIDFFGEGLRTLRRGTIGPWSGRDLGTGWVHVAGRIPIPPDSRDAIMTLGLLGATGTLEIDAMTFELIPIEERRSTNLVVNGDFELGDHRPSSWNAERGAGRSSPGLRSTAALELDRSGSRALTVLATPVDRFAKLDLSLSAKASGLRGGGGAAAVFFFVDHEGRLMTGMNLGIPALKFSGSFDWRPLRATVTVPDGAARAVLQFEKLDATGTLRVDDVAVTASPDPEAGAWSPYGVTVDTAGWHPVEPSPRIEPGSALDASTWFGPTRRAGAQGFVSAHRGKLHFGGARGPRARFFGVALLDPAPFLDPERSSAIVDRLARSGVNLVRMGDLDSPLGPGRSLFDDSRDDTKAFDPLALEHFDHTVARFAESGVHVALELHGDRRFRVEDGLDDLMPLPPGGGPAAGFEPAIGTRVQEAALRFLEHVNPGTGKALRDDPALAWVALAGEVSLFDLIEDPTVLNSKAAANLRAALQRHSGASGRRAWQALESAHWRGIAEALRKGGVKVPIASVSHWRREPEFAASVAASGFDLVDDRLYWEPNPFGDPDRRSLLRSRDGGLVPLAAAKRAEHLPYVVGQWCAQTHGAWALPHEGADLLLASMLAVAEDWDAIVRRGVFVYPTVWGSAAAGTGGVEDIFQVSEVINGSPQVYALLPHAASIFRRGATPAGSGGASGSEPKGILAGWDPERGRVVIDTPHTQGLAGWLNGESARCGSTTFECDEPFAVVVASSAGTEPIAGAKRLLVTALGRVVPTDFRWVDENRRQVADPGRPPLLAEPVRARVVWRRSGKGPVKAFALDATGARAREVPVEAVDGGVRLTIDGAAAGMHWELVAP